jgi:Phosphotransferase enzyme family
MDPDLELVGEALRARPADWQAVGRAGYTRSVAWRVTSVDGQAFVKQAEDEGSLAMLRREALVCSNVSGTFLPSFVGFADAGDRAVLAVEYLPDAYWPPPYPEETSPLFEALGLVANAEPPPGLPAHGPRWSRWGRVAAYPEPFLALGLCTRRWLEGALDTLAAAEAHAVFEGDELVHNDVYSGNVCFTGRGAVLVDWGAAVRGSRWIDLAFAVLSVRVEGGTIPALDFPAEGSFAAALAGHLAVEVHAPLPEWAEPESTLREDMAGDLAHALRWAADRLELPGTLP